MFVSRHDKLDAAATRAAAAEQPLSFITPVAYDPDLPDRLRCAHRELLVTAELLVEATDCHVAEAIAGAARSCVEQMHALRRLEALRLYPLIAHRYADDPEGLTAYHRLRLEVQGIGRRFLRVIESALSVGTEGTLGLSDARIAIALLRRYTTEKQARIFPLYAQVSGRTG